MEKRRASLMRESWKIPLVIVCFAASTQLLSLTSKELTGTKVAEGQYRYLFPSTAREEIDEKWVLYRNKGGYLVQSQSQWQSAGDRQIFTVRSYYWLEKDLTVLRWEMKLISPGENKHVRNLGCNLAPEELHCWDGSDKGRLAVSAPYELIPLIPPSAWFQMSLIRRFGTQATGEVACAKVVVWDTADGPSDLVPVEVEISYLGEKKFCVEEAEFDAQGYRLSPASQEGTPSSPIVAWVTREGLLVAVHVKDKSGDQVLVKLVQYEKYAEFGPREK